MVGPPISMFSISSASGALALAATSSKRYRFTTTMSIGAMPGPRRGAAGSGGDFLETVQVHHHHVDGHDAVRLDGRHVFGVGAHGENAAGDLGVHGLDAAIQHLGKSRDVADIGDGDAGV